MICELRISSLVISAALVLIVVTVESLALSVVDARGIFSTSSCRASSRATVAIAMLIGTSTQILRTVLILIALVLTVCVVTLIVMVALRSTATMAVPLLLAMMTLVVLMILTGVSASVLLQLLVLLHHLVVLVVLPF